VESKLKYAIFDTDKGWVGVLGSAQGLRRTTLPQRSAGRVSLLLGDEANCATSSTHFFADLVERLRVYFAGGKTTFPDKLEFWGASPFQHEVWAVTRLIPYGETKSYGWVARMMGKPQAVRAVGQALGRNPLPIIIPCHRVVASDSKLGGFSGGPEMKKYLLALEAKANI